MMIEIQFDESVQDALHPEHIEYAITMTFSELGLPKQNVTLRLTNDEEIHQLNLAYRKMDHPTDVLSFSQDFIDPETNERYLGDIIISVEQAKRQALESQHSLEEECAFLAIHGTLHLLGYDHHEPGEKTEMWKIQDEVFQKFSYWLRSVKNEG
jgi:probable rRNA maturation factor